MSRTIQIKIIFRRKSERRTINFSRLFAATTRVF